MNVDISIDSSVLESRALEALSTAVFYRNVLANAPGGWDLLNDPQYRELLLQLQERKTPNSAANAMSADELHDSVFQRLQATLDDGTYREKFPVGTILPDAWTDVVTGKTYDMPLRVVHYGEVATVYPSYKTLGATLLRCLATPREMVFSKPSIEFPFGSNRYASSDVDAYLRGDYMWGCSHSLRRALIPNVYNIPDYESHNEIPIKGFFLPSREQLHICTNDAIDVDQVAWEYFLDTPTAPLTGCKKRTFVTPDGHAQYVWLRSYYASSFVHYLRPNGSVNIGYPSDSCGVLPACIVIGQQAQEALKESAAV